MVKTASPAGPVTVVISVKFLCKPATRAALRRLPRRRRMSRAPKPNQSFLAVVIGYLLPDSLSRGGEAGPE
jgi:hypothetical protein